MKVYCRIAHRIAWMVACAMFIPTCVFSQLIEPTRFLGETEKTRGLLAVYSEPPELPVLLNGIAVGKTPFVDPAAEPGLYVVTVNEKEKQVRVTSSTAVRLRYYKGDLFLLPEKNPELPKELAAAAKKLSPQEIKPPQTSRDLEYVPFYWPLNPRGPIY